MDTNSTCTIYIVRHGETEWNTEGRLQGQKDSLLTVKGEKQAAQTAEKLKGVKFDAIFSSDLLRAKRTAEIIKLERQLEVNTTKALRERALGHHEGKLIKDYENDIKDLLEKYKRIPEAEKWHLKFANGYESDFDLAKRITTHLKEASLAYSGKTILNVTHGAAIKIFLLKIGYIKYRDIREVYVRNAAYVKLISDGIYFKVENVNGLDGV